LTFAGSTLTGGIRTPFPGAMDSVFIELIVIVDHPDGMR
jgi:hypothetical protein